MRDNYDIAALSPRRSRYAMGYGKAIGINISEKTYKYFQEKEKESGLPYQLMMSLYLAECAANKREIKVPSRKINGFPETQND